MRAVHAVELVVLVGGEGFGQEHLLELAGEFHFVLELFLLQLALEQALVLDGDGDDVRDGGDELHLVEHVLVGIEAADEDVGQGEVLVPHRDDHVELFEEGVVGLVEVLQAGEALEELLDVAVEGGLFPADAGLAGPALLVAKEERHLADAHLPTQKVGVHLEQPVGLDVVVDGLGDVQQAIDLQLLEVQFALQRFISRQALLYVGKLGHAFGK